MMPEQIEERIKEINNKLARRKTKKLLKEKEQLTILLESFFDDLIGI